MRREFVEPATIPRDLLDALEDCEEALGGELGTMRELEELGAAYSALRKQVQPDYVAYAFYSLPGARAALARLFAARQQTKEDV